MAESIDHNYIISEMIKHRLNELLFSFDPLHLEHKLFNMAVEDFLNYLRYTWSVELQEWMPAEVEDNDPSPPEKLRFLIFNWLEKDPKSAKEELDAWVSLWFAKWKERIKILFGPEETNKNIEQIQKMVHKGSSMMGHEELKQFKEPVLFTFISQGELAGTEILTDTIIKREVGKLRQAPREIKEKVQFLNTCMMEARALSRTLGHFIFVSVKDFKWRVETNG
jgi:hypothetical protein